MIRISDKSLCCGCGACMNVCTAQCIVMRRDREGFDYPVANPDLCIECGKCEEVCPALPDSESSLDGHVYVEDAESMKKYAADVFHDKGVVFAPVFETDGSVGQTEAENLEEMESMQFFSNVQSDPYGTFEDVKARLEEGCPVIYCCPPCRSAGLRAYLGKEYPGLQTMSCRCGGTGSPGIWKRLQIENRDYAETTDSVFDKLVRQGLVIRPSCYSCPFRSGHDGLVSYEQIKERREVFFRDYHSAKDLQAFMKRYAGMNLKQMIRRLLRVR